MQEVLFNNDSASKKKYVRNWLSDVTTGFSAIDSDVFKELDFFLHLTDESIDLDLIASCICESSYLEDFLLNRCQVTFRPFSGRFNTLIMKLRNIFL